MSAMIEFTDLLPDESILDGLASIGVKLPETRPL
jgi:hypothetical protein